MAKVEKQRRRYMFYSVEDTNGNVVYTGHSGMFEVSLDKIEHQERNWESLEYGSSTFREQLAAHGSLWTFTWLTHVDDIDKEAAQDITRGYIRAFNYPSLNESKDPRKSAETAAKYDNERIAA